MSVTFANRPDENSDPWYSDREAYDLSLEQGITQAHDKIDKVFESTPVAADTDLNDLVEPGTYSIRNSAIFNSLVNRPTSIPGGPSVVQVVRSGNDIRQEIVRLENASSEFSPVLTRRRDGNNNWTDWALPNSSMEILPDTDLNDVVFSGTYRVMNYSTANSLNNSPGFSSAIDPAVVLVVRANNDLKQTWVTLANASTEISPVLTRRRDGANNWTPWRPETPASLPLRSGDDLDLVTVPGTYSVETFSVATSLVNSPREVVERSMAPASVQVVRARNDLKQIWTTLQNASRDISPVLSRRRDSANNWTPWRVETPATIELLSGDDLDLVTDVGTYTVRTFSIATSLVNSPRETEPRSMAPASVQVVRSSNDLKQTWVTLANASTEISPVVSRRRDGANNWTPWELDAGYDAWHNDGFSFDRTSTALQRTQEGLLRMMATLVPDEGQPWRWQAEVGRQLDIPTHDGSMQTTHPSVLYFEDGWNGYKYWMAHTPYPFSNENYEDPNIAVSNDGINWINPPGLTNPLDNQPGAPGPHNSDTDLVMLPDGRMMVSWRMVDRPDGNRNIFYQRISEDGINWTPKQELYRSTDDTTRRPGFVSQILVRVDNAWRMYGIRGSSLVYFESDEDVPSESSWSEPRLCNTTPLADNRRWWHVEVQLYKGKWYLLVNDAISGTHLDGTLLLGTSDDGINWEVSPLPVVPKIGYNYDTNYKSAMVISDDEIELFYSAIKRDLRYWRINRTVAKKVNPIM